MSLVTRGLGDVYLITQGFAVSEEEVAEATEELLGGGGGGGAVGRKRRQPVFKPYPFFRKTDKTTPVTKRSKNATVFIKELTAKIHKTGVVKDKHHPYHPAKNRRFKVSDRQARRIAYKVASKRVMRVGRFR